MFDSSEYDVVVIGAGPAGCAAAAVAAASGLEVLLVEREQEPGFKIGESLAPASYSTFRKMGALERMEKAGFLEKRSLQFYSKSGKPSAQFRFDLTQADDSARSWQVLRSDFDQLLFEVAAERGAECIRGARVEEVLFAGESARGARIEIEGKLVEVGCKVVVDATGASRLVACQRGLGGVDGGLDHAAIHTHFRGALRDVGPADEHDAGATLILPTASSRSWFWYVPLAEDMVSVGVVGGVRELISGRESQPHEIFFEEVSKCPEVQRRIDGADPCRPLEVSRDLSYRCEQMAGDGWVMIGDAFCSIDPVCSSGIFLALKSGELAAEAIVDGVRQGDLSKQRLTTFRPRLMNGQEAVRRLVDSFYTPNFSLGEFLRLYPHQRVSVTRILCGDILDPYFGDLFQALDDFRGSQTPTQPLTLEEIERYRGS